MSSEPEEDVRAVMELCPRLCPPSPEPLPPLLCLLSISLAGWVKGQTTGKPQSVPGGVKWESPQTTCTAGRAISVPTRVVFSGAVRNQILHLPTGQITECILDQSYIILHLPAGRIAEYIQDQSYTILHLPAGQIAECIQDQSYTVFHLPAGRIAECIQDQSHTILHLPAGQMAESILDQS